MFTLMFTVFVIQSSEGYRYTGSTGDLDGRLRHHNDHDSTWTKRGTGWHVVYSEEFPTRGEAMRRERWLKSGRGREYLRRMLDKSTRQEE